MKRVAAYAAVASAIVLTSLAGLRPLLSEGAWKGLALAAAVAFPAQVLAFGALVASRHRANGFLTVLAGGTLLRFGLLVGVWLAVMGSEDRAHQTGAILGLAGFLMALTLLEAVFFQTPGSPPGQTRPGGR